MCFDVRLCQFCETFRKYLDKSELSYANKKIPHYTVNLRAMVLLFVEFARRHPAGFPGRIITPSSGQRLGTMLANWLMQPPKARLKPFALAAEVISRGITVNAIDPRITDAGWITPEVEQAFPPGMAMGRFGQPGDAAQLVVFLANQVGLWITG